MLQVTLVVELLSHVCGFLYDDGQAAALARLARTCKAFREPALNYLWRDQLNLGPLIRCMPGDLWREPARLVRLQIKFVREIEESDWVRFDYYSRKIRRLGETVFKDLEHGDVNEKALSALGIYRPAKVLLPNLRTVIFEQESTIALPCAQSIFGPSITSVCYKGLYPPHHFPLLCSSLLRLSPNIQEIRYSCKDLSHPTHPGALFRLIAGLRNLKVIFLSRSNQYVKVPIEHLSGRAGLRILGCIQLEHADVPLLSTSIDLKSFFFCADWRTCYSVLDSMRCSWEKLCFVVRQDPWQMSSLQGFTDRLSQHPSHISLKYIQLRIDATLLDGSSTSLSQALQPLLLCRALRQIELMLLPFHTLDDSWLLSVALAWSSLQSLWLEEGPNSVDTNFSLAGLIPLVKHCPELRCLTLGLNARTINPDALYGVDGRNMRSLCIHRNSTILHPQGVARSLALLFPKLKSLQFVDGIAGVDDWKQVKKWLEESAYKKFF